MYHLVRTILPILLISGILFSHRHLVLFHFNIALLIWQCIHQTARQQAWQGALGGVSQLFSKLQRWTPKRTTVRGLQLASNSDLLNLFLVPFLTFVLCLLLHSKMKSVPLDIYLSSSFSSFRKLLSLSAPLWLSLPILSLVWISLSCPWYRTTLPLPFHFSLLAFLILSLTI